MNIVESLFLIIGELYRLQKETPAMNQGFFENEKWNPYNKVVGQT
jgi:hypothetical protein